MDDLQPVKEGDLIKETVIGFGTDGDPIVKYKNFTLFIKEAKGVEINTLIEVRVTKVCKTFGFVELVN